MKDKGTRQLTGVEGSRLMNLFMKLEHSKYLTQQAEGNYVRYAVEILESRGLSTETHQINMDKAEIEEISNGEQNKNVE